jgi:protein SCO1
VTEEEKKPLHKNPWLWAVVFMMVLIPVLRPLTRRVPDPPPVISKLPEFSLTDQSGKTFGTKELEGRVWVASFFFTSCVTVCPRLMAATKTLQERYAQNEVPVHLVSITVDPDTDTPEKLAAYAQKIGADPSRWTFLTGDLAKIHALIREGFLTHVGDKEVSEAGVMDIGHGGKLMLVDGAGGVRGAYESSELGLDEIFHRAQHVLRSMRQ